MIFFKIQKIETQYVVFLKKKIVYLTSFTVLFFNIHIFTHFLLMCEVFLAISLSSESKHITKV